MGGWLVGWGVKHQNFLLKKNQPNLLLLRRLECDGGPIFKVVLKC